MHARTFRTGLSVLATTLVATLVTSTAPAAAGSSSTYRVTGKSASTYWTQVDGTDIGTPFGNVHEGWLNADETSNGKAAVFGWITDWDCEPGEQPGHGHGDEPTEGLCDHVGVRSIEGWDVAFTLDKRLDRATLTGPLTVYGGGHGDGGVVGRPQANITWTGVGEASSSRYTSQWREGSTWYSDTYRSTNRSATMGGTLGAMGFAPDLSGGWMHTFKSTSRQRTR